MPLPVTAPPKQQQLVVDHIKQFPGPQQVARAEDSMQPRPPPLMPPRLTPPPLMPPPLMPPPLMPPQPLTCEGVTQSESEARITGTAKALGQQPSLPDLGCGSSDAVRQRRQPEGVWG